LGGSHSRSEHGGNFYVNQITGYYEMRIPLNETVTTVVFKDRGHASIHSLTSRGREQSRYE